MKNMFDMLYDFRHSDNIAIVEEDGTTTSYNEIYNLSIDLAKKISDFSTNVLLYTGNQLEFVIGLFAAWFSNKTVVPLNKKMTQYEIENIATFCESNCIMSTHDLNMEKINIKNRVVITKVITTEQNIIPVTARDNNIALILPTTGTTSNAKFVMLTHENLISEITYIIEAYNANEETKEVIIIPITTVTGCVTQLLSVMFVGGMLYLYNSNINPSKIAACINEIRATIFICTPSILTLLLNYTNLDVNKFDSLELIAVGGEKADTKMLTQFANQLNLDCIIQAYGLTETSSVITGDIRDKKVSIESVGKPMKGIDIKIWNSKGTVCDVNEEGEVYVKGNNVMIGYYKDNKASEEILTEKGLATGDLGYFDKKGYLYITGRIKNVIIVGGQNVHAEEVEEVIKQYKGVQHVIIYAQDSKITGEKLIGEVVCESGFDLTEAEIIEHCRKTLSSYKIPKRIIFREKMELHGGKIIRRSV